MFKVSISRLLEVQCILLSFFILSCSREGHISHGTNSIHEADLLAIYEREGYDEVFVVNHSGDEVAHYILIGENDSITESLPSGTQIIRVPLRSAVIDSEVYAGAFEELGATDVISGFFDASYVTSSNLKKKLGSGTIVDLGPSMSPNSEKILALQPDAILVSYFDGMQIQEVDKLGFPIIKMYDLQESSPLGRAEWLRFIGRLLGRAEESDSIFYAVKSNYNRLTNSSANSSSLVHPKVLTELIYQGTWSVPGGKSYQASLIKDAGGSYFRESDKSFGSLNLLPEQVIVESADADVWLIRFFGNEYELKSILDSDPLYKEIKAYYNGNIFFSDTSASGLFREFPFHPDLLLQDYSNIFMSVSMDEESRLKCDNVYPLRYFKRLD